MMVELDPDLRPEVSAAGTMDNLDENGVPQLAAPVNTDPRDPEWIASLPESDDKLITVDDFFAHWNEQGAPQSWRSLLKNTRAGRLPFEVMRNSDGQVGVTYESAEAVLIMLQREVPHLSFSARFILKKAIALRGRPQ